MGRLAALLPKFDWVLLGAVFVLIAFGLAAIYSVALSTEGGDLRFFEKQLIAFALGILLIGVLALSNYKLFRNWTLVLYVIALMLLVGVFLFGTTVRGTTGWYRLLGFSFQPVEFVKFVLVFVLAKFFSEKARRQFGWRELVVSGLLTLIPAMLVLLQPDFGSAAILLGVWAVFVFFAGIKWRQAAFLGVLAIASSLVAWFFVFAEYQKERVLIFLDPMRDPLVHGYNVLQAIIAIGSGKFFGRGLGFGSQSQLKFLPESQTDFIFAVIAEELGFVGVLLVIGALVLFFLRLFRLVRLSRDDYTSYLLIGFAALLFVQIFINIGMNLGVMPVTGIALPFVSYGGSSLLVSLAIIGLLESIAVRSGNKVS